MWLHEQVESLRADVGSPRNCIVDGLQYTRTSQGLSESTADGRTIQVDDPVLRGQARGGTN